MNATMVILFPILFPLSIFSCSFYPQLLDILVFESLTDILKTAGLPPFLNTVLTTSRLRLSKANEALQLVLKKPI